jgi:hypothetical protein
MSRLPRARPAASPALHPAPRRGFATAAPRWFSMIWCWVDAVRGHAARATAAAQA